MSAKQRAGATEYDRPRDRVLTTGDDVEIAAFIRGMRDIERVQEWVAFENRNRSRTWVLEMLANQAAFIRGGGGD